MTKIVAIAASIACLLMPNLSASDDALKAAVENNSYRAEMDTARDKFRHPYETLSFFGVTADQTVIEVNPGSMWYSRILGPLLRENGKYVGLEHLPEAYKNSPTYMKRMAAWPGKFDANRDMFGPNAVIGFIPGDMKGKTIAMPEDSVDTMIVVRAIHNWQRRAFFAQGLDNAWRMLKPGGVLGIVQHRMPEDRLGDRHMHNEYGRWKQSELVAAIESYGFKLAASSEINANPKDTADQPGGVWQMAPGMDGATTDEEKARRLAIGESDRMTLKFVKVARPGC